MNQHIPIKEPEIEAIIRQKPTKDLVAFDFGLMFTEGSKEVQIYVDEHLQEAINGLLQLHGKLIIKVNIFSPDVVMITPAEI